MTRAVPAAAGADNALAVSLFRHLAERYDLLAEVLSFGQNARWRRELVNRIAFDMITHPKEVQALFDEKVSQGVKDQIAKRDAPKK